MCAEGGGEIEVERDERFAAADMEKGSPSPKPVYWRPAPNPVEVEPSVASLPFEKLLVPLTTLEEGEERKENPVPAVSSSSGPSSPISSSPSTSGPGGCSARGGNVDGVGEVTASRRGEGKAYSPDNVSRSSSLLPFPGLDAGDSCDGGTHLGLTGVSTPTFPPSSARQRSASSTSELSDESPRAIPLPPSSSHVCPRRSASGGGGFRLEE